MPRPQTRHELLARSQAGFEALGRLIDALPAERQNAEFPVGTLNRNIRDVLAHLHHWHLLLLEWYATGMRGETPVMPAPGYTWKTLPELNREIQKRYAATPLETIRKAFEQSHADVHALIERHTEAELFEKKRYKWTGSTSLGAYLVSSTSSHYDWAEKFMRKVLKVRGER